MVHKFLIKNTIEESIHQATTSNADNWDRSKVTLQNLINLFNETAEISSTLERSVDITDVAETEDSINRSNSLNVASSSNQYV